MPRRPDHLLLPPALEAAARRRHGLLTTAELAGHGLGHPAAVRTLLRRGALHRVHRSVFSVLAPPSLEARVAAAGLLLGPAVACLSTAAALHGIDGAPPEERLHLSLPPDATRHQLPGVTRHWLALAPEEICSVRGVPVTTPARLILDAGRRWDREAVVSLTDSALRVGAVTPEVVAGLGPRLPARARSWMTLTDDRAESPLESRMRLLLHDAGIAGLFQPQWTVRQGARTIARIDLAAPRLRFGIECDGRVPHELPEALFRDRSRADDLAALGWRLLRATWTDVVAEPAALLARVRRAVGIAP